MIGCKSMECPLEIVDASANKANHRFAIANAMLGPANPSLPNAAYWQELAKRWEIGLPDALARRCNNCEHYIDTAVIQDCIQRHGRFDITSLGSEFKDMGDASGYCTLYHITCTASRVCVDWEEGGPITTTKEGAMAIENEGREDAKKMSAKQKKIAKVIREFKAGTLKGSDKKPIKNKKQAIAIALSEAGMSRMNKSDEYWDAYVDTMMCMEVEDPEEEGMGSMETEDGSCGKKR